MAPEDRLPSRPPSSSPDTWTAAFCTPLSCTHPASIISAGSTLSTVESLFLMWHSCLSFKYRRVHKYGCHLEVEDEPGSDALPDDIHEEVGDGKQPHVRVLQAVLHQQRQQAWLVLLVCKPHTMSIILCKQSILLAGGTFAKFASMSNSLWQTSW